MTPEQLIAKVTLGMFRDQVYEIDGYNTSGFKIHSLEDGVLDIRCYVTAKAYIPTDRIPEPEGVTVIEKGAYEDDEIWTRIIWKVDLK